MLSEKINAFINAKKCFGENTDILFVNLDVQRDTLYLDIANTYPNLKVMQFVYDTTMYGVRTLFLGKKIKGFYKKSSNNNFPSDIVEINKNQRWLLEREFTNWYFVYYKGILIRKSLGCDADTLAK
ncbi:hypothetical protein GCM10011379_19520 [Filimonas zeae]|uniref:Uncharacterized protein n=2 Tax=Filimonas zeae TaxID=1737353 RepID=A0A917IZ01_9BACT|nr:hypothetical protein GCM10011379_19520 [Filimonas zeae]